MGQNWFLKFYPFRVADVMVPLIFWLIVPAWVAERGSAFVHDIRMGQVRICVDMMLTILYDLASEQSTPNYIQGYESICALLDSTSYFRVSLLDSVSFKS